MNTYKITYKVERETGIEEKTLSGVIGFSFGHNQGIIGFEYQLTDVNRLLAESFLVEGKLIAFILELE